MAIYIVFIDFYHCWTYIKEITQCPDLFLTSIISRIIIVWLFINRIKCFNVQRLFFYYFFDFAVYMFRYIKYLKLGDKITKKCSVKT